MDESKYQTYVNRAKKMGAKEAKIVPAQSVVIAGWVRKKCQFGCEDYGKRLTCPPRSPTPDQTRGMLSNYRYALLVHGDKETSITRLVASLEREVFLDGHHKAFGMGAGPCELCEECEEPCRYPHQARPSMEACGIDVFSTVKAHGFPIEVLKDEGCRPDYYGLVLID